MSTTYEASKMPTVRSASLIRSMSWDEQPMQLALQLSRHASRSFSVAGKLVELVVLAPRGGRGLRVSARPAGGRVGA